MKSLNLTDRIFQGMGITAVIFAAGFFFEPLLYAGGGLLGALLVLLVADVILLYWVRRPFSAERECEKVLSLSDPNSIRLVIGNESRFRWRLGIVDELPVQLQKRDLEFSLHIGPGQTKILEYQVSPLERGEYAFGRVLLYAVSLIGLAERRHTFHLGRVIPVYPSLIQMRRYELRSMERLSSFHGVKKLRKIGHSYEFETIKNYVTGDDIRAVNWKATSRRSQLMVNQYEDEKSQQIYAVIDKSRSMMLPFNGLSLLDWSVNTSLVMANCALQKHDRAGLVTFSDRMGSMIRAENGRFQMKRILETLYNEQGRHAEADFELLYQAMTRLIPVRSMIFLYTNFESAYALQRVIHILRRINHRHLLIVVNFENAELSDFGMAKAENLEDVYLRTLARKMVAEKQQMAALLTQHRIQAILTRPEDLSVKSVNKYLELKARGMI